VTVVNIDNWTTNFSGYIDAAQTWVGWSNVLSTLVYTEFTLTQTYDIVVNVTATSGPNISYFNSAPIILDAATGAVVGTGAHNNYAYATLGPGTYRTGLYMVPDGRGYTTGNFTVQIRGVQDDAQTPVALGNLASPAYQGVIDIPAAFAADTRDDYTFSLSKPSLLTARISMTTGGHLFSPDLDFSAITGKIISSNFSNGVYTVGLAPGTYRLEAGGYFYIDRTLVDYNINIGVAALPNSAPTGAVNVTGTAQQGQTLQANASTIADADGLGTLHYQWQRSANNGSTWTNVGTDKSTYALGSADTNNLVRVIVNYTDGNGTAESVASAATGAVAMLPNHLPTGSVSITGTLLQGQTLQTKITALADIDGLGTLHYQWQQSKNSGATWTAIGSDSPSYQIGSGDVGSQIRVSVRYTDGIGYNESLASAPTAEVPGQIVRWARGVSGIWETNSNWLPTLVPGFGDQAAISAPGSYTVTLATAETIKSLAITNKSAKLYLSDTLSLGNAASSNAGTIEVGAGTSLMIRNAFNNTGTILLDTFGADGIHNNNGIATLSNAGKILGAGSLGDFAIALTNLKSGIIDATDTTDPLTIDLGANVLNNAGTIRALGAAGLVIEGDVSNSGNLFALASTLHIKGTVTGTGKGVANIGYQGTLEFDGSNSSQNVTFANTPAGTLVGDSKLVLGDSSSFAGMITGFALGHSIHLEDIGFGSGFPVLDLSYQKSGKGGVLTVIGTETAHLTFVGQYSEGSFAVRSDPTGGVLIEYQNPSVGYLTHSTGRSSGAVIGSHTVLTASHCLYSFDSGTHVKDIQFFPGYQGIAGNIAPISGPYRIHYNEIVDPWGLVLPGVVVPNDYAIINYAHTFSSSLKLNTKFTAGDIVMSGYPSQAQTSQTNEEMTASVGTLGLSSDEHASPGNSGGPLLDSRGAVVGVVSNAIYHAQIDAAAQKKKSVPGLRRTSLSEATTC
jgi:V8-like Glu-specific endopeptidase